MIRYNKRHKSYYVFIDNKYFVSYSENRFGIYAEELAKLSQINHKKYKNYYDMYENSDVAILRLYSKTFGYNNIMVDKEDVERMSEQAWCISSDQNDNKYATSKGCTLGRFLLELEHDNISVIVFKDNNRENYLKNNLTIVSRSELNLKVQTDMNIYYDANRIWRNVKAHYMQKYNRFRVIWYVKNNGKSEKMTKDIYFDSSNFEERKHQAIVQSIKMRKANGYILCCDDINYITSLGLEI